MPSQEDIEDGSLCETLSGRKSLDLRVSDIRMTSDPNSPVALKERVAMAEQAATEAEATLAEAEADLARRISDLEKLLGDDETHQARMEIRFAEDIVHAQRALAFAKRRASAAIAIEAVKTLVSSGPGTPAG